MTSSRFLWFLMRSYLTRILIFSLLYSFTNRMASSFVEMISFLCLDFRSFTNFPSKGPFSIFESSSISWPFKRAGAFLIWFFVSIDVLDVFPKFSILWIDLFEVEKSNFHEKSRKYFGVGLVKYVHNLTLLETFWDVIGIQKYHASFLLLR